MKPGGRLDMLPKVSIIRSATCLPRSAAPVTSSSLRASCSLLSFARPSSGLAGAAFEVGPGLTTGVCGDAAAQPITNRVHNGSFMATNLPDQGRMSHLVAHGPAGCRKMTRGHEGPWLHLPADAGQREQPLPPRIRVLIFMVRSFLAWLGFVQRAGCAPRAPVERWREAKAAAAM